MIPPIEKSITVPCDRKTAYDVFLNRMSDWWPMGKFTYSAMKGAPATGIEIEPRTGGAITETGADGTRTSWGHVETLTPHSYLALRFHIPAPGHEDGGLSFLEVTFTEDDRGTRVDLKQSDFEGIGAMAEMVRGGYGHGWTMIFEGAYAEACAGL